MEKEVHMSNQLLNKYAEIISSLKASNGIKIISVEENKDNELSFPTPPIPLGLGCGIGLLRRGALRGCLRYWR